MKYCNACGMPLEKKEDFALGDENSDFCVYCTNSDGSVKSYEELFEGAVQFFMKQLDNDRKVAEKFTRKAVSQLPYWQGKDIGVLKGEMASDEELEEMMKKM